MRELTIQEIQEALNLRRDGWAKAWDYQVSHKWFTLRIEAPNIAGNFHLLFGGCERLEFDTYWQPINITVEKRGDDFIAYDEPHLFIRCGLLFGHYNEPPLFGFTRSRWHR